MTTPVAAVEPARTALLVMDYQPAILSRIEDRAPLVSRVRTVIDAMRRAGGTVGYVRVGLTEAERAEVPERNKMFRAFAVGGHLPADGPETAVIDELAPRDGDVVVRKRRVGALSTTDLDGQLGERGITTLVLAGVFTSGVVLSTVRDCADKDYRLLVLSDCCADADAEAHDVLLTRVFPRQADVLTGAEFVTGLPERG